MDGSRQRQKRSFQLPNPYCTRFEGSDLTSTLQKGKHNRATGVFPTLEREIRRGRNKTHRVEKWPGSEKNRIVERRGQMSQKPICILEIHFGQTLLPSRRRRIDIQSPG